jgi:hypothetical protein
MSIEGKKESVAAVYLTSPKPVSSTILMSQMPGWGLKTTTTLVVESESSSTMAILLAAKSASSIILPSGSSI